MARHSDPLSGLDDIEAGQARASALLIIEQGHLNNWWACPTDCPCPDECEYGAWLANLLKLAATVATSLLAEEKTPSDHPQGPRPRNRDHRRGLVRG